jgi:hypothetical protein
MHAILNLWNSARSHIGALALFSTWERERESQGSTFVNKVAISVLEISVNSQSWLRWYSTQSIPIPRHDISNKFDNFWNCALESYETGQAHETHRRHSSHEVKLWTSSLCTLSCWLQWPAWTSPHQRTRFISKPLAIALTGSSYHQCPHEPPLCTIYCILYIG